MRSALKRETRWPSAGTSSIGGPLRLLGRDSAYGEENSCHDRAEDEPTDVCEERDTTATFVRGVNQCVVAFEELVEEPATEKDPRRDADREPQQERADA